MQILSIVGEYIDMASEAVGQVQHEKQAEGTMTEPRHGDLLHDVEVGPTHEPEMVDLDRIEKVYA